MKQEERLLKRGRGEGKVQVFDETCTFYLCMWLKKVESFIQADRYTIYY